MPLTILVTGGAGFIGKKLCQALAKQKHLVICIDNLSAPHAAFPQEKEIQCIPANFHDISILSQLPPLDVIFHMAAKTGVRDSLLNPESYEQTNAIEFQSFLKWAQKQKLKTFIYPSSSSVYGHGNLATSSQETDPLNPLSPYAKSKVKAEEILVKATQTSTWSSVICRLFSVYGPGQRPDMAFPTFSHQLLERKTITLYNPKSHRDYTYIEDIIDGLLSALRWAQNQSPQSTETFNLGSQSPIGLGAALKTLNQHLKTSQSLSIYEESPFEAQATWANLEKSQQNLGYNPSIPFEKGIQLFCLWFLKERR